MDDRTRKSYWMIETLHRQQFVVAHMWALAQVEYLQICHQHAKRRIVGIKHDHQGWPIPCTHAKLVCNQGKEKYWNAKLF